MCLKFGFVIFWQKDFGAQAAHKMLVKLTPEVRLTIRNPLIARQSAQTGKHTMMQCKLPP